MRFCEVGKKGAMPSLRDATRTAGAAIAGEKNSNLNIWYAIVSTRGAGRKTLVSIVDARTD